MMQLDYIPSDEELEELLNAGVSFTEEIIENGYLAVSWHAPLRRDWSRTLHLVKHSIPKLGRKYDGDTKRWIIAPDYIPLFEHIKSKITSDDNNLDLDMIDSEIEQDIVANILGTDFRLMSPRMREKALYVFDLYLQCVNGIAPPDTKIIYCISDDTWGAFHPESGNWWYSDGRYSGYSPQEKDQKVVQIARQNLARQAKLFKTKMSYLDSTAIHLPSLKQIFRNEMLAKYNHQCFTCGDTPDEQSKLHMHRVIPGKDGGEYIESNVVILCSKCHRPFEGECWETLRIAHSNLDQE